MNRNPNQFKRSFQPQQVLQFDRRNNEDQKVQPLVNNFSKDDQQNEEEVNDDIHLVIGSYHYSFLTQDEYEEQLMINQFSEDEYDVLNQDSGKHPQQTDPHKRYDLRRRSNVQKHQKNQ